MPSGLTDVTALAAGYYHNLALHSDGTVTAWGFNAEGQTNVPKGLAGVTAVAAGWNHSLAVSNGTVTAWGFNADGQTDVPAGLTDVIAVAAGTGHSLALTSDGTVVQWPGTAPAGLDDVIAIDADALHSIALHRDGTVTTWGSLVAPAPADLTGVTAVATGYNHSIALKNNGTVVAWGKNDFGQTTVPDGLDDVVAIAAGGNHNLALTSDGTVLAWGENQLGQSTVPAGLTAVTAIYTGTDHSIVLSSSPAFTADAPPITATVGTPYSYTFATVGASTFELTSGTLPAGLTLTPDGVLSGTPTTEGDSTFTVLARSASGTTSGVSHTITVVAAAPTISGTAAEGVVGSAYDYTYTVTGAPAPEVSLDSGSLPPGLTLDGAGRLTGTPTTDGTYTFTVAATNTAGTATTDSSLAIAPAPGAPTISGTATDGVVGSPYDYTYTVTGDPTPDVSIYSGNLPGGLTLDRTGRWTGTPTEAGTFYFTLTASNTLGTARLVQTSLTVTVATVAPTISGTVAAGVVDSAYDYTYTVTGTPTPDVTLTSGTLAPGLTLDKTGRLSGTPTKAGTYRFTVAATSTAGTATADSTLAISPKAVSTKADLRVDVSAPTTAVKGKQFTYTVTTKNAGPATSTSVYSKVILPPNTQFVSATGKYARIGNLVLFQRSILTNGQSVTEKITVKATGTGKGTALAATFSVKTPDPLIRSNVDTAQTTVR